MAFWEEILKFLKEMLIGMAIKAAMMVLLVLALITGLISFL